PVHARPPGAGLGRAAGVVALAVAGEQPRECARQGAGVEGHHCPFSTPVSVPGTKVDCRSGGELGPTAVACLCLSNTSTTNRLVASSCGAPPSLCTSTVPAVIVIVAAPGSIVTSQPGRARTRIFSLPEVSSRTITLPAGVRS